MEPHGVESRTRREAGLEILAERFARHAADREIETAAFLQEGRRPAEYAVDPMEGEKSITHWSWSDGCKVQTSPTTPSPCVAYQGCKNPVITCKIPGVGHKIWDQGPKATWDFFASL